MSDTLILTVEKIVQETDRIRRYILSDPQGGDLPAFDAGAHIDVVMGDGMVRQYSMMGDPADRKHYVLGVLLEKESRGGSQWMFDTVKEGQTVALAGPRNSFPLQSTTESWLIGGGIGVTPMFSMAEALHRAGKPFTLFYLTRSREETAFLDLIENAAWRENVKLHHDGGNPSQGFDVAGLLKSPKSDTTVYCCGPTGLNTAVKDLSSAWPSGSVRFEYFTADPAMAALNDTNTGFKVVIKSSGQSFDIGPDESIADILQEAGLAVDTSCCEGVCGACITPVLEGEVDHRDSILTDEERDEEGLMTLCCSRAKTAGTTLVLDL